MALIAAGLALAADAPLEGEFGKDIQLAPFKVKGAPVSVSIHARTKADRVFAEKFANEVVEVAYETLGNSTGRGLVIVGAKGEPHPILLFRKFVALAHAGQLDASLAGDAAQIEAQLRKLPKKMKVEDDPVNPTGITFETFVSALPMPLEGVGAPLYQIAWAEGFDEARVERKLKTLTHADLARPEFKRYDWVFYVPPQSVMTAVFKDVMGKTMKAQKMGVFKRAAVRSAVFVFNPVVKKAFDAMRKGVLFMTILRAESTYNEGDIDELTKVYVREVMPDLKPGSGDERRRALAAIEKQKIANIEYAKDPFVKPERLAAFAPAAYARFEGDYTSKPPETTHRFTHDGDSFYWSYRKGKPRAYFPAGERLFVNESGTATIQFIVDGAGVVTGVEERWVRHRKTIPRKEVAPATSSPPAPGAAGAK